MNMDEKDEIEKEYALLSDAEIEELLLCPQEDFEDGVYHIVLAEAKKRGITLAQAREKQKPPVPENYDAKACPNCLAANSLSADFCEKCRCPIGGTANIEPLKQIEATGFIYKRSVSGPVRPIVLAGNLFFIGTILVASLGLAYVLLANEETRWAATPFILLALLDCAFLYRMIKNYRRHRRSVTVR